MLRLCIAPLAAVTLLAGCGGGSPKTVTTSSSLSQSAGGGGSDPLTSAAACFKAAGAFVRGPKPAGRGSAIYATTRDQGQLGFVKAPDPAVAARLKIIFTAGGQHPSGVKHDPTAFAIHRGTLTASDAALLTKCAG